MLTGSQIRRKFLDFFIQKGHREVHSSSLVPANDPTLLFTNAGMNQFKDVFLGLEKRDYNRATTSQKCVRAGGKHNDLENVGFTNRHHTFFEMLGNFSFGDYFKDKAIAYAWELMTSPDWFGIDKAKLYVTIFQGSGSGDGEQNDLIPRDTEAYELWVGQGVPTGRIFEMGLKDNFWQMGDTGPCGPCSEIHYDMGPAASEHGHTDCAFTCDCGRYVELWNLVFMQFDRDTSGKLNPLPKPSIDTGLGIERLAAVLQGVISNYDTDLFTPLIVRASDLIRMNRADLLTELGQEFHDRNKAGSLRVIADHSRAATFLVSDGVIPSNEGRGYVLRKIIRRAITHGRLLGQTRPFLHEMVFAVRDLMQDAYPELRESADRVSKAVLAEEKRFAHTMDLGLKKLEEEIVRLGTEKDAQMWTPLPPFPGERAFKLYDTFGMPLDFITDALHDQGIAFDQAGFDRAMAEQRERARASWKGAPKQTANPIYRELSERLSIDPAHPSPSGIPMITQQSKFVGYTSTEFRADVLAIVRNGVEVRDLKPGEVGEVILDWTPFYAESGGQVGDRGWFYSDDHNTVVAEVTGCYYPVQGVRAHQVTAKHPIRLGQKVDAVVDTAVRESTMRNHTATHLLQAGLREVLGKHVKQAGSLVAPNHLRFDFSHFTGVAEEELQDIEDLINKEVLRNERVEVIENVPIDVAINEYHAMALFGEKYGDRVRVIKIGDFSTELCGGTHTAQTGEIGLIKILKEGSVSSGVRRIEAVTGEGSLRHFREDHEVESFVSSFAHPKTHVSPRKTLEILFHIKDEEIKRLTKELDQARMKSASSSTVDIGDKVKNIDGIKVLTFRSDDLNRSQLRTLGDQLREKIGSPSVVAVGTVTANRPTVNVSATTTLLSANQIIKPIAHLIGGKGGGRDDFAEAGGKDPSGIDAALEETYLVVAKLLSERKS
ncbi:MAG TPA: alanine--tRNA ligase [Terriglobales bacterium]|jgi:alanyl-tRNA synthetase|nr:alanine--tRNA ligase [Terriglobales bacterium]